MSHLLSTSSSVYFLEKAAGQTGSFCTQNSCTRTPSSLQQKFGCKLTPILSRLFHLLCSHDRASLVSQGAHPGKYKVSLAAYAVVGSGAMLGGVSRMLLSTVVIIMETSGAENLTIPLIIASAVGK
eukprot:1145950-Pelagomonas_calceolata.AAC.2